MIEPGELEPGIYEHLVTERIRQRVDALIADGRRIRAERVDRAEQSTILAAHVASDVARILELVEPGARVEAVNSLLRLAATMGPEGESLVNLLAEGPEQLLEVSGAHPGRGEVPRPTVPLRQSELFINGRHEPALSHELAAEMASADRIDLICAFVKWSGLRLVIDPLREAISRGVPVRVITTTYVGVTEKRAVDELVSIGAEVRIAYESQRTRLHAKAWLFERSVGLDTAYIGSSNLSWSALTDGLEWNVRLSRATNPAVLDKFAASFEQYWVAAEFEPYDPSTDGTRLDEALGRSARREPLSLSGLEVRPFPFQQQILDALDAERNVHGRWRNLVVAATGTGKTVMAALDYRRLRAQLGHDLRLLFVAHRKEILEQSLRTFREVLTESDFGELYVGGDRPDRWLHVFASIQSLSAFGPQHIEPGHFDAVIIDEFHRADAPTYEALLSHLQPQVLLGLTATPERADGGDVTRWFDGRIAAEIRLWEALSRDLLCPFHYFGVADDTNLESLEWRRGGYDLEQLGHLYTGNDARTRLILRELERRVTDPRKMRALGFCVSVAHAHYMAAKFNEAGLRARALDATTPSEERRSARRQLREGEIQAIFTVDLFNEGVDIPEVDTILFLRPTESATVFLQQLGRGLRHAPGKAAVTVLDFIGQQHRRFRWDLRYRALTGAGRAALERNLEHGFPFLPSGCHIHLDRVASRIILSGIRSQIRINRPQLARDVASYGDVTLATYLEQSGRDLSDVYRSSGSWTGLRRTAGLDLRQTSEDESALLRRVHRFALVDDDVRVRTWQHWLASETPPVVTGSSVRDQRLAAMFVFNIWNNGGRFDSYDAALAHVWSFPAVRDELRELLELAHERIHRVPLPLEGAPFSDVPLQVHAQYSREEILAGLGSATMAKPPWSDQAGVRYIDAVQSDVFTFTLRKSEADYSPTTMYRDYLISDRLVHWESQNTTSLASPTGQRYINHRTRGTNVLLFARMTEKTEIGTSPFLFLGPASIVRHSGERPIAIVWELDVPAPAEFVADAQLLAG